MNAEFYKLMLITHRQNQRLPDYLQFIETCLCSGVTSLQLREKEADPAFLLEFAKQLKKLVDQYKASLIINDNLELALEVDAQGLHLGQTDGCPMLARKRLGSGKFLGLSIETEEDLIRANRFELDYVAASAIFPSEHKMNLRTIWGLEGLKRLANQSKHPVIAIGGVNQHNTQALRAAGAKGIAVIGALHQADNPSEMTSLLRSKMNFPNEIPRN